MILLVDEVSPKRSVASWKDCTVDWSDLVTDAEGVDFLLALSPNATGYDGRNQPLRITPPPKGETMLPWRLTTRHRNSHYIQVPTSNQTLVFARKNNVFIRIMHTCILVWCFKDMCIGCGVLDKFEFGTKDLLSFMQRLHLFILKHGQQSSLSPEGDDFLEDDLLPSGKPPVWMLRSADVGDIEVLEAVKESCVEEGENVMVVSGAEEQSPSPLYWETHGLDGELVAVYSGPTLKKKVSFSQTINSQFPRHIQVVQATRSWAMALLPSWTVSDWN